MFRAWFLFSLLSLWLYPKSSVWQIQNDKGATIYLGGSIHLLRKSDYPLPKAYEHAYEKSDTIVFETDIKDEAIATYMAQDGLYKDIKLKDKLKPATYQALERYTQKVGFPIVLISKMKAPLAMLSLSLHKYQSMDFYATNGVDLYFYNKALENRKKIDTFETPREQFDMLLSIGKGSEDKLIEYTLHDLENMESYFTPLMKAWRVGDRAKMHESLITAFEQYPQIYQTLLVERNQKWLAKITNYFNTQEVEFVLVGTAHLLGKDGLLQYFEKNGYKVKQVK